MGLLGFLKKLAHKGNIITWRSILETQVIEDTGSLSKKQIAGGSLLSGDSNPSPRLRGRWSIFNEVYGFWGKEKGWIFTFCLGIS